MKAVECHECGRLVTPVQRFRGTPRQCWEYPPHRRDDSIRPVHVCVMSYAIYEPKKRKAKCEKAQVLDLPKQKRNKYRAVRTTVDGITFASKKEAQRYCMLKLLEKGGYIKALTLQPTFDLHVNGIKIGVYRGDFRYLENCKEVIEDSKGVKTAIYRRSKKHMKAEYGIDILES